MGKISLKAARVNRGLTQDDLARLMDVHRNTVSSWESNPQSMSIEDAGKICTILEISINNIFFENTLQSVE